MDVTTVLSLAIALIIVLSGYYLFNGLPQRKPRRVTHSPRVRRSNESRRDSTSVDS